MARRVATTGASGSTCVVDIPDAGWTYTTTGIPGQYDLRLDGVERGWVHLAASVEHHALRMAEIAAGLNHQAITNPGGWEGPAAEFVDDIRTGVWPRDRLKYPEAWRARTERILAPTHVIAGAGAPATLCGLVAIKGKLPLPYVLARFARAHVDGYGRELCAGCAHALAELEEATVDG
jgi:hypothetical protein